VLLRSLSGNHTARAAATCNTHAAQAQIARAVDCIHSEAFYRQYHCSPSAYRRATNH